MAGGTGGGSLLIVCESYRNNGVIKAKGGDGSDYGGGGGGGGICIVTGIKQESTGTYDVSGGKSIAGSGYKGTLGANGGNGIYHIFEIGGDL